MAKHFPVVRMALAASLAATTAHAADKPPVCNGKDRRPVNLYGSVLPGSPTPALVAPSPDTSPGKPPQIRTVPDPAAPPRPLQGVTAPPRKPGQLSASPTSYRSC